VIIVIIETHVAILYILNYIALSYHWNIIYLLTYTSANWFCNFLRCIIRIRTNMARKVAPRALILCHIMPICPWTLSFSPFPSYLFYDQSWSPWRERWGSNTSSKCACVTDSCFHVLTCPAAQRVGASSEPYASSPRKLRVS